jgi:hypothetical protein
MPIVYMRAQTPGHGTGFHLGLKTQNGRRGKPRRPLNLGECLAASDQQLALPQRAVLMSCFKVGRPTAPTTT